MERVVFVCEEGPFSQDPSASRHYCAVENTYVSHTYSQATYKDDMEPTDINASLKSHYIPLPVTQQQTCYIAF